jgi:hypothetical protein
MVVMSKPLQQLMTVLLLAHAVVQVGTGGSVTYTSASATPVNDKFTYRVCNALYTYMCLPHLILCCCSS